MFDPTGLIHRRCADNNSLSAALRLCIPVHIIFYLHLLISIERKASIDNLSDLVDPNLKPFAPMCRRVLIWTFKSSIWSTADHYLTKPPSHTAGLHSMDG